MVSISRRVLLVRLTFRLSQVSQLFSVKVSAVYSFDTNNDDDDNDDGDEGQNIHSLKSECQQLFRCRCALLRAALRRARSCGCTSAARCCHAIDSYHCNHAAEIAIISSVVQNRTNETLRP